MDGPRPFEVTALVIVILKPLPCSLFLFLLRDSAVAAIS